MSHTRSSSAFFSESKYSLAVKIFEHARNNSWKITRDQIRFINAYLDDYQNLCADEKLALFKLIFIGYLQSKDNKYHSQYKIFLNAVYEQGIAIILTKNFNDIDENELNIVRHYHSELEDHEKIILLYAKVCHALKMSGNMDDNNAYNILRNELYDSHTNLLKGIMELLYPESADDVDMMINPNCSSSPAA